MTTTQPAPNISTENSQDGSDRHPSDSLDRETEGGQPQERPEDRPHVGEVTPDDYPKDERQQPA